jgi:ABC-type sugar transport system ATPase subunit
MPTSSSSVEALLDVSGVQKSFGSVIALSNASLVVEPGTIHALMGGNGSGKSTLSKVLLGVVRPDAATVIMNGAPLALRGPLASRASGISGTFQETALAPDLTIAENILLDRMPRRFGVFAAPKRGSNALNELLDEVGIPHGVANDRVGDLSLELQSLAELARVLRHRPKLLIVDELTASLRREAAARVGEILRRHTIAGGAVLFVSHRSEEIIEYCDSATVLRAGRTVFTTNDITSVSSDELLASMTGEAVEVGSAGRASGSRDRVAPSGHSLAVRDVLVKPFGARVSFTIGKGEIVGIAGISGNGQSELLKTLFGAAGPIDGAVSVGGNDVRVHSIRDAVRSGIGYLSGEREREMAFGLRSVGENLAVVVDRSKRRKTSPESVMEQLRLVGQKGAEMRTLSGGNQQKVVFGRWIAAQPDLLLADDPTRGVDVTTRREIHRLLRELAKDTESAVLISSSDDHELAEVCDRVYVLHQGAIVNELAGNSVTEQAIGIAALTGHIVTVPDSRPDRSSDALQAAAIEGERNQ